MKSNVLCKGESSQEKIKNKKTKKFIKAYKTVVAEKNVALFTFLQPISVKNDWQLFYLPYKLFSCHQETCPLWIHRINYSVATKKTCPLWIYRINYSVATKKRCPLWI